MQPLPQVSYFLAMSYVKQKSWADAASVADTALQNEMDDVTTKAALYYIKSGANMEQNKLDDAIAAAEKAVELVPNDEQYMTHLERLKNAKG